MLKAIVLEVASDRLAAFFAGWTAANLSPLGAGAPRQGFYSIAKKVLKFIQIYKNCHTFFHLCSRLKCVFLPVCAAIATFQE